MKINLLYFAIYLLIIFIVYVLIRGTRRTCIQEGAKNRDNQLDHLERTAENSAEIKQLKKHKDLINNVHAKVMKNDRKIKKMEADAKKAMEKANQNAKDKKSDPAKLKKVNAAR
jgi:biopolymer transport protein ExbB/TolQ